jgi:hypothetical protein
MCGRDDPWFAGVPVSSPRPAQRGGEPWRSSGKTSCTIRKPDCREIVANLAGEPGDRSRSLGLQIRTPGGAVPTVASARSCRAIGHAQGIPKTPARPVQLIRCQLLRGPRRQVFVAGVERFSRLCVLMNPCPAGRAVHRDLPAKYFKKSWLLRTGIFRRNARGVTCESVQLTNRRIRTFIAAPSAKNVNSTEDPP